jgi:hypothetical protein
MSWAEVAPANRRSSTRTCALRTEPKIVVLAFKIDENARSSGSRENPRMSVVRVFGTGGGLK